MRLTPASRQMSTRRPACATSVVPTFLNGPLPPKVIVPMVSTETRRPDFPSARYSMPPTLPSVVPDPPRQRPLSAFRVLPRHRGAERQGTASSRQGLSLDGCGVGSHVHHVSAEALPHAAASSSR